MAACLLLGVTAHAQQISTDYRKAADTYFKKGDYASAVAYYEKYLGTGVQTKTVSGEFDPYTPKTTVKPVVMPDKQQVIYQLAESWRLLKNHTNAAPLYAQVADNAGAYPLARYHYATSLRALGKYSEAEQQLQLFLNSYGAGDQYKDAAGKEIKNLQFIQQQLKKGIADYSIQAISGGRVGASYAPLQLNANTLLFTATWPDSSAPENKSHVNRLYKASYQQGKLGAISRVNHLSSASLHEGAATLSSDGNTLYLTKWAINKEKKSAAIYISKRTAETATWSTPVALDSVVNKTGFNSQQPFIMPDGKHLVYASDKPGGLGGYDLWSAELNTEGKPVNAVNVGEGINTSFNEQAPYYHTASATLVFATDGRTGMGGYDLFYATGTIGQWSLPQNFGYPVNSVKDDMYFTSFSKSKRILESIVLSSDRADVCCLELFQLKKKNPPKQVFGQIVSCDSKTPLSGVSVEVMDTASGKRMFSGITDENGKYAFPIEESLPLSSMAALRGYQTATRFLQLPGDIDADSLWSVPVCMQKEVLVIADVKVLNNVYYEFAKADVKVESYPSLDELVAFLKGKPELKVEIGGHTDDKGSEVLNSKLSEARAANVVAYLVSKGIDKNRLTSKGYGATMPIAPNKNEDGTDNPEGREKNRRTEMKVLQ
jgi:outer membrane protein OmpA-like peptidoglycan-associated protein/tetratricopeptide (TPR) repeat protein